MLAKIKHSREIQKFLKSYFLTLLAFSIPITIQFMYIYGETPDPKLMIMPIIVSNIIGVLLGWNSVLQYRLKLQSKAKNDLISSISHEIRNPLTVIKGYSSILLNSQDLSDNDRNYIENVYKSGEHILGIISDLLDISHIESGKIQVQIMENLLTDTYEAAVSSFTEQLKEKGMEIEVLPFDRNIRVLADSTRLHQILVNFISNAIKYGNENSQIKIRTETTDDTVKISVVDNGPGIEEDKLSQLFIPFNRLGAENTAIKGNGIGLALCKRLVEVQNGKIGVNSVVDKGCEFWFELPVTS